MELIKLLAPNTRGLVTYTPFMQGPGTIWQTLDAPDGLLEDYVSNWQGKDVTLHALARRMPVDKFLFGLADLIPESQLAGCDFWQSLYAARDIHDMSGVIVGGAGNGAEAVLLGIFSPERHPEIAAGRAELLNAVSDHIRGAVSVHWRIIRAENTAHSTKSLLDRLSLGILWLTSSGKVLYVNASGRRMLDRKDAMLVSQGVLVTTDPAAQCRLDKAVASVMRCSAEQPFTVPKLTGGALTAIAAPAEAGVSLGDVGKPAAVLFLSDPKEVAAGSGGLVASLYGLSRAEAEVAQSIAEGLFVEEISQMRGVSTSTVRSQVKAIMAKIGANRQSEIVRAVLATSILDHRC